MIPEIYIEQWRQHAPWQTLAMVEQDLVISRALVDLYNHPKIQNSLVFRGGTALNKLYLQPPTRYSEDIDFVQSKAEPIGDTINAIREVLDPWLGEPKRKLTERCAKLVYRYNAIDQTPARLKVEINTTEHLQIKPLQEFNFVVDSEWFHGKAVVMTYQLEELMATKLRALYQRRKGRDLFDLWYTLDQGLLDISQVLIIFEKYCQHYGDLITRAMFEQSLFSKKQHIDFQSDMTLLLAPNVSWDFATAMEIVEESLIMKIPGEPWKSINKKDIK
ncbi:nucleotidyl transferase AbiEii/AbiGii toxin family protein [soil metagenome]